MGPDRRINPAWTVQFPVGNLADYLFVERFTHAVQALEFILARIVVLPGQLINGCQGVGVVGGELRIDQARHRQQLFRAGEVGDVGIHFTGIDRIAFEAVHLRAFDFTIPVGPFYQADHQATAAAGGKIDQGINDERAAFLIGLNDEADPVPAGQLRFKAQLLQQVERDLQAIGLFGIDVNPDIVLTRQQGQ